MGFAKAAEHPDVRSCQRGLGGKWADGMGRMKREGDVAWFCFRVSFFFAVFCCFL